MEFVRKHVGTIAGVAVVGMVLWLVASAVTAHGLAQDVAGSVFKKPVPLTVFARAHDAASRQALMTYGEKFREKVPAEEMDQRAWERMVFLHEAKRKGIRVSDKEVIDEIAGYPLFRDKDGAFDKDTYQHLIQYSFGATPRAFEEETRENLTIGKLIRQISEAVPVSDADVQEAYRRKEEAIRATVLAVPDAGLAQEIADAARQQPSWISRAAAQLGKEAVFTPLFKRADTLQGLPVSGSLFDPVFGAEPGEVFPRPLRTPAGDEWLVVRLDEKQPADPARMDEEAGKKVRAEVEEQKKMRAYLEWYVDLLKRADIKKNPALAAR